jgi:hypothetical protein
MPATSNVITIGGTNENEDGANVADVGSLNLLLGENQIEEVTVCRHTLFRPVRGWRLRTPKVAVAA